MDKNKNAQIIAKNIRKLINQLQISNSELAKRSEISTAAVSKILNGNMNITVNIAISLAKGLQCSLNEIFDGLDSFDKSIQLGEPTTPSESKYLIGIMSIERKRFTVVCDNNHKIIGKAELEGGLDLVDTSNTLYKRVIESIDNALSSNQINDIDFKEVTLNLVTQSHEFTDTKLRFNNFMERYFKEVNLLPDWQITYFSAFGHEPGISLILDKGTSLSFLHKNRLHKLGGWKFPIWDFGGENWIGNEAIKHTIAAKEGYVSMSSLAEDILSKHNNSIDRIVETCFKSKNADIFSSYFPDVLNHLYRQDEAAIKIMKQGYEHISQALDRAYNIIGNKVPIAVTGSLSHVYHDYIEKDKLSHQVAKPTTTFSKVTLLATITRQYLQSFGL